MHRANTPRPLPHLAPTPCVVLRMSGWMWSHGYDYHNRNRDREAVMKGLLQKSSADVMNKLYAFSGFIPCSMPLNAHSTANMSPSLQSQSPSIANMSPRLLLGRKNSELLHTYC